MPSTHLQARVRLRCRTIWSSSSIADFTSASLKVTEEAHLFAPARAAYPAVLSMKFFEQKVVARMKTALARKRNISHREGLSRRFERQALRWLRMTQEGQRELSG